MKRPGINTKSKRQTLHQQAKIKKRTAEHNRKQRKAIRKGKPLNSGSRFTKRTKDPGIPNNCPFSDQILKEAQDWKVQQELNKEEMKIKQQKWQKLQYDRKQKGFSSVSEMLENIEKNKKKYEIEQLQKIEDSTTGEFDEFSNAKASSAKGKRESVNFWRQVNQVIEAADIILEILDARDPEGSRCKKIEKAVKNKEKKLILILNKIDLIPSESGKAWLKFYRRTIGPTLAFKAATQHQKSNISQKNSAGKMNKAVSGTSALLNYLANYGRLESDDKTSKIRTAVTVGVVGLPNVGKSSIINTIKRNKACKVGAEPGITRNLQTIQIDSHVKLIDSPGIVLTNQNSENVENSAIGNILLSALSNGNVENSRTAAIEILKRVGCLKNLAFFYDLEVSDKIIGENPDYFLACLAIRKGMLKKGARPDLNAASKFLVKEWTSGRLSFHTMPPESIENNENSSKLTTNSGSSKIKLFLDEEFDEDEFLEQNSSGLDDDMAENNSEMSTNTKTLKKTCVLFKVPEKLNISYKVDLNKNDKSEKVYRKRKIEDEEMEESGHEDVESSTATFTSQKLEKKREKAQNQKAVGQKKFTKSCESLLNPNKSTTEKTELADLQANFKIDKNTDLMDIDSIPTEINNQYDKNIKKYKKKRKKLIKKSNIEMEGVSESLGKIMKGDT